MNKIIRNTLVIGGGITIGMVTADLITGGAVRDVILDFINYHKNIKVSEVVDNATETAKDVMAEAIESM